MAKTLQSIFLLIAFAVGAADNPAVGIADFADGKQAGASFGASPDASARSLNVRSPTFRSSGTKSKSKSSIGGFFAGILLWCLIPPCLWNNERIAIKQAKLQGKAKNDAVIISDINVPPIDQLEGHIVFANGETKVNETLTDKHYQSVKAQNCVKLRRVVQMYQWVEEKKEREVNGEKETYYEWHMEWKDEKQECPNGGSERANPEMPLPSSKRSAEAYQAWAALANGNGEPCAEAKIVNFGQYYCGEYVRRELTNWKDTPVNDLGSCSAMGNKGAPQKQQMDGKDWFVYGSGSQLGDVRVRFEQLECGPLSVCGILAKTEQGWTFVPVIHEDGSAGESLAQEFGCSDDMCPCLATENVVFTGQPNQDFLDKLSSLNVELKDSEKDKFRKLKSSTDLSDYKDEPATGDLCCTCCIPNEPLLKMMHFVGLEEEFLGVQEQNLQHKDMMGTEKAAADRRHNACRIIGIIAGLIGADLIISPVTNFLNSNWLIWFMGGGLISCALCCVSCLISLTCTTGIISVAWVRHRPRMVFVLLLAVGLVVGGSYATLHAMAGPKPATGAQGEPTAAPVAAPVATAAATAAPSVLATPAPAAAAATVAPAAGAAATCATYVSSCPPTKSSRKSPATPCKASPCSWEDCCTAAAPARLLARRPKKEE